MAYQLRSRKDPASLESQEQTDTPVGNLTETQVTTLSQTMFVPPQLSETEHVALPVTEADLTQTLSDVPSKPEIVATPPLDIEGPTRLDPGLGSAALSVGATLTGAHVTAQQLVTAHASAVISYQCPPADTVGPPSAVIAGRDAAFIGNQTQQLYGTIDTLSLSLLHDSQEVKHTIQAGTTLYLYFAPFSKYISSIIAQNVKRPRDRDHAPFRDSLSYVGWDSLWATCTLNLKSLAGYGRIWSFVLRQQCVQGLECRAVISRRCARCDRWHL